MFKYFPRVIKKIFFSLMLLTSLHSFCQLPYGLTDGRQHKYCEVCTSLINQKPAEVLFGIQINKNGDIYFSMSDKVWFDKIFRGDSYGVTVDLVSKERYACNAPASYNYQLPKGTMIQPAYRPALLKGLNTVAENYIFTKIGKVPAALMNKEIEGNLVILNGNLICYYTNFLNIDRNVLTLLPMGLFTDSLIQDTKFDTASQKDFFTYTKRMQLEIPFLKGSTSFSPAYMSRFYDSLGLEKFNIRKVEIRAYSSVEGAEKINNGLMQQRANSMVLALKKYAPFLKRIKVLTAENWLEFFNDIEETKFSDLKSLSKIEIKQKLTDKILAAEMEPILSKHRKAVLTMYLEEKSSESAINETSILSEFKKAVSAKEISKARAIQKELVERVIDNKLPLDYINRLEVPGSKEFSSLLNDREVYKYLLQATSEYEALDNFVALQKIDPDNGRINYNICALRFFMWQNGGDSTVVTTLLKDINTLQRQGINSSLIKRMLINYHITKSEVEMRKYNYAAKDSSLNIIRTIYKETDLNDDEIYSLARFYAYYAHYDWAEEIITPRVDKINVNENLVFFYVNLLFFRSDTYDSDNFRKAMLNSINLNNKRFCNFFLPNDKGGAGMQLLEFSELKTMYCSACK